ncbi:MAG: hypothetical protein K6U11_01935 [bacterium]|nr:hypothetical protein [bacterium]
MKRVLGEKNIIWLLLFVFSLLLVFDPAAYARCTQIMPDEFLDILDTAQKENMPTGVEGIISRSTFRGASQDWLLKVFEQSSSYFIDFKQLFATCWRIIGSKRKKLDEEKLCADILANRVNPAQHSLSLSLPERSNQSCHILRI